MLLSYQYGVSLNDLVAVNVSFPDSPSSIDPLSSPNSSFLKSNPPWYVPWLDTLNVSVTLSPFLTVTVLGEALVSLAVMVVADVPPVVPGVSLVVSSPGVAVASGVPDESLEAANGEDDLGVTLEFL